MKIGLRKLTSQANTFIMEEFMKCPWIALKALIVLFSLSATSAYGYKDGTYSCKNSREGLPDNTFAITTATVAGSIRLPYVEMTRYYKSSSSGPVESAVIRGLATHVLNGKLEILTVAAVSLEFEQDRMLNCDTSAR